MKLFRQILFWTHLVSGLIAGIAIAIMSFTGVLLAFEQEIVEWAERDARRVTVPADAKPLPLVDLQRSLIEHAGAASAASLPSSDSRSAAEAAPAPPRRGPDPRSFAVTLRNDPAVAVAFSAGREGGYYANPYTGEIRQPASTKVHDFMRVMLDWHRYLGREGDSRPAGKLINGTCNLAFCLLAVTGLYLWMPRTWSWRGVKAVALLRWNLSGKARDFNWHNAIGLWCAPILIVLTLTAVPISFRWGGNLIYRLMGEPAPAPPGAVVGPAAPGIEIAPSSSETKPLGYDAIVANVQRDFPNWKSINLRSGALQRGGARPPAGDAAARPAGPPPITVTVREHGSWPRTATTTLTLHPFTGDVLKQEGHDDLSPATRVRRWTRFLHTGQALGWGGQFVAGLASLGGVFLVYTGFALSWRRFFGKRRSTPGANRSKVASNLPESQTAELSR